MWACEKGGDSYREGIANDPTDERRAERSGNLGEVVLAHHVGLPNHILRYIKFGDKWDLEMRGWKFESKCGFSDYGGIWITRLHPPGDGGERREAILWSDFYVRSLVIAEDRAAGWAKVALLYYCTVDTVRSSPTGPGRGKDGKPGLHEVYKVPMERMSPMCQLDVDIEGWK